VEQEDGMQVKKICEKCPHYRRRTWTHAYEPAGYHTIGMTHAYAYCEKHKMRCLQVRKCNRFAEKDKGEK